MKEISYSFFHIKDGVYTPSTKFTSLNRALDGLLLAHTYGVDGALVVQYHNKVPVRIVRLLPRQFVDRCINYGY